MNNHQVVFTYLILKNGSKEQVVDNPTSTHEKSSEFIFRSDLSWSPRFD